MRKAFVVAMLACSGVCLPAAPASAGIDLWEFLSELHGPGPFWAVAADYRFLCLARPADVGSGQSADETRYVSWLHPLDRSAGIFSTEALKPVAAASEPDTRAHNLCVNDQKVRGYATLNVKYRRSYQNNLFPADLASADGPAHTVTILELSASYFARLHDTLDVGTRIGIATFRGEDFDTFHRLSLDAVDVRFYPIAMLGDGVQFRAFALTFGAEIFIPGFTGADFCNPAKEPGHCRGLREYNAAPHLLGKWGISIDVVGLMALVKGR